MLRLLGFMAASAVLAVLVLAGAVLWGLYHYGRELPDYSQLAAYEPPTLTRLHAGDGRLLAEFATEKRVFVPIQAMPRRLIQAFISAEDKNFQRHPGVDIFGIARAAVQNISNIGSNRRLIGASTITQQVAKNFLLSGEVSYERKIKEALLALRIEKALSKAEILELYLNEIFLGQRAYGVAAAAINYFNRSLDELSLSEIAYLAGLPKGPNNYHPERQPESARARRNYVLRRMLEDRYIRPDEAASAMAEPIVMRERGAEVFADAPFFTEEVRRQIAALYGEDALYEGGLSVRTTVNPRLQSIAVDALRQGLIGYDRRHGWRGPIERISADANWPMNLMRVGRPAVPLPWRLAVVLGFDGSDTMVGFADGQMGRVPFDGLSWARPWLPDQTVGPDVESAADVVAVGDVVLVEKRPETRGEATADGESADDDSAPDIGDDLYDLRQKPNIEGAIVALDPHTGRVLAMSGGWNFEESEFNRATQARRQPGSAFKPFVYLSALEHGYTPASLILDAPFTIEQGPGLDIWKPQNYSRDFYGPSTMRIGVEKSRNVMTVRLANKIGIGSIQEVARRFGIGNYPGILSIALGSGETTLINLVSAYASLVNGGRQVDPAIIERIQDRDGQTIYRRDQRECTGCQGVQAVTAVPTLVDTRPRLTSPATAFQLTWILKGVVDRGTGRRISTLGRPLAGKTGTTNESFDTWFVGFSPDLVVGVFIGFDEPRTLGPKETGSNVAAPVFKAFFEMALEGEPAIPFRIPPSIRMVRIDAETGVLPGPNSKRVILEAFRPGTEPRTTATPGVTTVGAAQRPDAAPSFDSSLY